MVLIAAKKKNLPPIVDGFCKLQVHIISVGSNQQLTRFIKKSNYKSSSFETTLKVDSGKVVLTSATPQLKASYIYEGIIDYIADEAEKTNNVILWEKSEQENTTDNRV